MSKSSLMRAIRVSTFGGPKVLKLASDVEQPCPEEKEVLIKVHAVGVNPVETYIRGGTFGNRVTVPYTPGGDLAGVVQAVGSGITKFKEGDRVWTVKTVSGAYAEYATANELFTFRLPESLTFAQGAALGIPYLTAYKGIMIRAAAKSGDTVLVHGASGAVGLAACQIAKAYGMKVVGTAGTEEGLALARSCGAAEVFNHREKGYMEKIMNWTGGKGVDVILEMVANVNLPSDLEILAYRGRVIVIGANGPIEIDPVDLCHNEKEIRGIEVLDTTEVIGSRGQIMVDPRAIMGKETDVRGMSLFSAPEADIHEYGQAIVKGADDGWVKPVVGVEFNLEEADKAHEEVIAHKLGTKGKIVLKV